MVKKIMLFLVVVGSCLYHIPTHAFGDPFADINSPFYTPEKGPKFVMGGNNYTKNDACMVADEGWNQRINLSDLKWPGSTYITSQGVYKKGQLLYYGVGVPASGVNSEELATYTYDCVSKQSKELFNIIKTLPFEYLRYNNGTVIIYTVNENYMILDIGTDIGYRSPNLRVLDMKTLQFNKINLIPGNGGSGEDIKNLYEFVDLYKGIIEEYENQYKDQMLVRYTLAWISKIAYPNNVYSLDTQNFYNVLSNISDFLSVLIQIHNLDESGNGYISMEYAFNICSKTTEEQCQNSTDLKSVHLPILTAPINIMTRSIDISKIYRTIGGEEIKRLNDNGLTKYNTLEDYGVMNYFTREQAAKFFAGYATTVMKKVPDTSVAGCEFSDMNIADQTLKSNITTACQLGLFKGFQGKFDPKRNISHEEAATVLVRLLYGEQDESMKPWYNGYVGVAREKGLIVNDGIGFDIGMPIERGEIGQMLYKAGHMQ